MRFVWVLRTVLFAALGACDRTAGPSILARQVVLPESAYLALPVWALDDEAPACTIDADRCAAGIAAATTHVDGSIAFWGLDGKRSQLYRVDSVGRPLAIGRLGSGPGEYRFHLPMGFGPEGELLLADLAQRRVMRYATDGRLLSTVEVPVAIGLFNAAFVDGKLLALATEVPRTRGDSMPVSIEALDDGARQPRRLATLPVRRPGYAVSDLRPMPARHAAADQYAFDSTGALLTTTGAALVVDRFDAAGAHVVRFGFDVTTPFVSDGELEEARGRALRGVNEPRMRRALEESMQRPGSRLRHPAITRLMVAADGSIWVRGWPTSTDSVHWVVFSAAAEPLGRIILGDGDVVMDAREGRVLLARDEDASAFSGLRWSRLRRR
jgi:hypothetical protein